MKQLGIILPSEQNNPLEEFVQRKLKEENGKLFLRLSQCEKLKYHHRDGEDRFYLDENRFCIISRRQELLWFSHEGFKNGEHKWIKAPAGVTL